MAEDRQRPRLLTIHEARAILGVSETTMRQFVRFGRVPFLKVGALLRFDPEALERWIAEEQEAARNRAAARRADYNAGRRVRRGPGSRY